MFGFNRVSKNHCSVQQNRCKSPVCSHHSAHIGQLVLYTATVTAGIFTAPSHHRSYSNGRQMGEFFLQNTKHHGRRISKLFKSYSAKSIEIWISIQTKDRIALERETNGWKVYSWRGHGLIATVSFCHLEVGWHMMFFARGPCCHATSDWDIVIQSSFYLPEWQQRQSELHAPPPLAEVNLEPCCCLHHCCCGPRWQHFHRWELHRKQHLNLEFASRPGRETCTCCWLKPSLTNIWVPPPPMIICVTVNPAFWWSAIEPCFWLLKSDLLVLELSYVASQITLFFSFCWPKPNFDPKFHMFLMFLEFLLVKSQFSSQKLPPFGSSFSPSFNISATNVQSPPAAAWPQVTTRPSASSAAKAEEVLTTCRTWRRCGWRSPMSWGVIGVIGGSWSG